MPMYKNSREIEAEVRKHCESVHYTIANIQMRTTADGHIACKEPLCFWVSKIAMELSDNQPKGDN